MEAHEISPVAASLAARTASVLLIGLAIVQMAGLTIHAFDRLDVQRLAQARDSRCAWSGVYRTIALTDPPRRADVLAELHRGPELVATLSASPPQVEMPADAGPRTAVAADQHEPGPAGRARKFAGGNW